jgi:RNA polymerase sigma-70 factor (ECF subfamily)
MPDWTTIVEENASVVWQAVYRVLRDRDAAEDCVQDAFLSALSVARPDSVRDWRQLLVRIGTRRAIDHLRIKQQRSRHEEGLVDPQSIESRGATASDLAEASELATRLRCALAELPPRQAEVFCLRCFSELTYQDIAELLGLERSHVGALLHRARKRLQELMAGKCGASRQEELT